MKIKSHCRSHARALSAPFLATACFMLWLGHAAASGDSFQAGEILLNNLGSSTVQRYSPAGVLAQTYAGTGADWEGASLTPDGNLITAFNTPNAGIDLFNPAGAQIGTFAATGSGFTGDVSVFADGTLALCDQNNQNVKLFSQTGTLLSTVSLPGTSNPFGSTVGTDNILYVAGNGSGTLAKVSQAGVFLGTIPLGFAPGDLVMNPADGTLWVSDWSNDVVDHITTTGTLLGSFSTGLSGAFAGIGLAPDGNSLYVTTTDSTVIRQLDLSGNPLGDFNISSPSTPWFMTVVPAPEPGTGGLALLGGLGLLLWRRNQRGQRFTKSTLPREGAARHLLADQRVEMR